LIGNQSKEDKAIGLIYSNLQRPFSKIYVNKYFSDKTKNDIQEIVDELRKAYEKRINNLDWMSDETKKNAINKLVKLKIQIGYIDKWDDYSSLRIRSYEEGGSLWENISDKYNLKKQKEFSKLNQNVEDEEASSMEPLTVEAWYMPNSNTISIPAAVLQGEIYNINWSKEKKMGTLGTLIGHEISHAFDNCGAQYDAGGNLKNWWTQEDLKKFEEKTNRVKSFYSQIKLENGKYVNGDLTVGENIADIGGVAVALDVLGEMKNPNYKEFFEGYAGCWHEIMTKEAEESSLKFNPHSPRKVRINAVLGQFDKLYETYGIKEGDKMYVKPEDRLKIW
jgi:putative endopeptidase